MKRRERERRICCRSSRLCEPGEMPHFFGLKYHWHAVGAAQRDAVPAHLHEPADLLAAVTLGRDVVADHADAFFPQLFERVQITPVEPIHFVVKRMNELSSDIVAVE